MESKRIEFSKKMKKWFFDRDSNKCQAPFSHECDHKHPLQLHHILPYGYLNTICDDISANYPENGIILCRTAHEIIHPDVVWARRYYHKNNESFGLLKKTRKILLEKRRIYWNDKYDRQMTVIALVNTRKFKKSFPEYHPRRGHEVIKNTKD
jgi:hypothetical protein